MAPWRMLGGRISEAMLPRLRGRYIEKPNDSGQKFSFCPRYARGGHSSRSVAVTGYRGHASASVLVE